MAARTDNYDYRDLREIFGNPDDFEEKPPWEYRRVQAPLVLEWSQNTTVYKVGAHPVILPALVSAINEAYEVFGDKLWREGLLCRYGGCIANRPSRGLTRKSVHAWGLAVDIAVPLGPLGAVPMTPAVFVDIFKKHGFLWGGDWRRRPDGMHFTAVRE